MDATTETLKNIKPGLSAWSVKSTQSIKYSVEIVHQLFKDLMSRK